MHFLLALKIKMNENDKVDILENEPMDFLLEKEKNKIEEDIIKEINEIHNEVKKEEELIETNKRKTKRELIEQFMVLQETQKNIIHIRPALNKMRKDEIIKAIANYTNEAITNNFTITTITPEGEVIEVVKDKSTNQLNALSHTMYSINIALVNMLEIAGDRGKSYTGDVSLLEGWSKNVRERKEAFLIVFKAIYEDYKLDIDKYLSPVAQYGVIMFSSATEVIVSNISKKKEQSKTCSIV